MKLTILKYLYLQQLQLHYTHEELKLYILYALEMAPQTLPII